MNEQAINLQQKIQEYDLEIQRLKAIGQIQNLMGRYEVVHLTPEEIGKTPELFALWREDCSVEVSSQGAIFGYENSKTYWTNMKYHSIKAAAFFHALSSPIIEVAGNCKTAKATWMSPGFECAMELQKGRQPFAAWCFGKYAMDFIRHPETGEWKIWHMHWFRLARNDFDKDFIAFAQYEHDNPPPQRAQEGDYTKYPTVFHRPLSVTEDTHPFPVAPKPYYDYDGNFRWQYGGEEMEKKYGVVHPDYEQHYNVNYPERI